VVLVLLLCFAVRSIPWPVIADTSQGIRLFGADPYYHLRRAVLGVRNNLHIPYLDYYAGYPKGTQCFWHPAVDNTLALVPLALRGEQATETDVWAVAVWFPPLVGVATVAVAMALTALLFGGSEALGAGVALSLLPAHVYLTLVGRVDHHAAEPLFPILALLLFVTSLRRRSALWAAGAGAAMVLGMVAWTGSLLYMVPLGLLFVVLPLASRARTNRVGGLSQAVVTLWVAGAGTAIAYAGTPWTHAGQAPFDAPGLVQPLLFALLAVGATVIRALHQLSGIRTWQTIAAAAVLMAVLVGLAPPLRTAVSDGLGFLTKEDPWLQSIEEFKPLFRSFGHFDPDWAEARLSRFVCLAPALILISFFWLLGRGNRLAALGACLPAAGAALLALTQKRYAGVFAVAVTPLVGWWFARALRWVREAAGGGLRLPILAALCVAALWPCGRELYHLRDRYRLMPPGWEETLDWLRDRTPATSFFMEPKRKPEYGILASHWGAGHWITQVARRPAVANGFHTNIEGNQACAAMLFARTEKDLDTILEATEARYLVLANAFDAIVESAPEVGESYERYLARTMEKGPTQRFVATYAVKPEMAELAHARLFLRDGKPIQQPGQAWTAFTHYRLVYETAERDATIGVDQPAIKVFERVAGSRVSGSAPPGAEVKVQLRILTNAGRRFLYAAECRADSSGRFELTVPYSTETIEGRTNCYGPALVTVGSDKKLLEISEQAVLAGQRLSLDSRRTEHQ
jgi:asparagine N-glycosylation enzyme membrane subunit Stt3